MSYVYERLDQAQMACDLLRTNVAALQRELEASEKQKEIYRQETHRWKEALAAAEAKCERMKALIDRIACSNHPKYVNCEVAWQEIAGTCAAMRDEPPSISLDFYHKERNRKELVEVAIAVALAHGREKHDIESLGTAAAYVDKYKLNLLTAANDILKRLTE